MPDLRVQPGEVVVAESGKGRYAQVVLAGRHVLAADEPESVGGSDTGPGPYEYLLAALGACTAITLRMYAARKGWPLERVAVRLRQKKIHAEDCAECETKEGRIDRIDRTIELSGALGAAERAALLTIADKCPVHRTLSTKNLIVTELAAPER
ncbi:MAG: OsmC family protein [Acetobacteraceae bacterium]